MHYPYTNHHHDNHLMNHKMTVTGTGSLSIEPNLAFLYMEVITENERLCKAQEENSKVMQNVLQTLMGLGVVQEHIQTNTYTIQPKYDYTDGKQILKGYTVRNAIIVKTSQINQVGQIIDLAVEAGINRVTNIRFSVENLSVYYDQALKFALEDALRKAETMAGEMQLHVNPTPVFIKEKFDDSVRRPRLLATTSESYTTPIEPGQLNVKAEVTVQYSYH